MVEIDPSEDRTQRRLGDLHGRRMDVLNLGHRHPRLHHAVVSDGGDAHRDVVAGDRLLGRDGQRHGAQADSHHAVDRRHQQDQSRPAWGHQPSEPEHDAALVLPKHAHGCPESGDADRRQHHDNDDDRGNHAISSQPSALRTPSVRPLTRSTTTLSPCWISSPSGCEGRAFHSAPSTRTVPSGSFHLRTTPRRPVSALWWRCLRTEAPLLIDRPTTPMPVPARRNPATSPSAIPPPSPATASTAPAATATTPGPPSIPIEGTCASTNTTITPTTSSAIPIAVITRWYACRPVVSTGSGRGSDSGSAHARYAYPAAVARGQHHAATHRSRRRAVWGELHPLNECFDE